MPDALALELVFDPDAELLPATRECEAEAFLRTYGNTRDQLENEYGPYEPSTVFIALADSSGEVLGAVRIIGPGPAGLKIFHDVQQPPWLVNADRACRLAGIDVSQTWEIATLSVRRKLHGRQRLAAVALYHGITRAIYANKMAAIAMIMDRRARSLLNAVGLLQSALPGTGAMPYLGSGESTPLYAHCPALLDNQRRVNPEAYRLITMGVGLDGIVVPNSEAFRFDQLRRELRLAQATPGSAVTGPRSSSAAGAQDFIHPSISTAGMGRAM